MCALKNRQNSIMMKGENCLNTKDNKIQWHPAFDAALRIELQEETKYLTFEPEHLISKKPMQIDILIIKKDKSVQIKKNIGKIFRQYNIIEYKSPEDTLCIDDFYKVYGYACIYKAETEKVNAIPAAELTITFVCYHYPREMLAKLKLERKITASSVENGIYYLEGDAVPIQLIVVQKLSKESNYWLNTLRNDLKAGGEIRRFIEQYENNKNNRLYSAVADTVMRANWKELEAEKKMCDALKELFAEELQDSRTEGRAEGRTEGRAEEKLALIIKKYKKGCTPEETADMLEETAELIQQIYDVLNQCAPDYNVQEVYQILRKKAVLIIR